MELQALDALDEVRGLLRGEQYGGKKKSYKKSTVKGWSSQILRGLKALFHLYTGDKSTVKGQWIPASQQAVQSVGSGTTYASTQLTKTGQKISFVAPSTFYPMGFMEPFQD